jgi:hypothetical protein
MKVLVAYAALHHNRLVRNQGLQLQRLVAEEVKGPAGYVKINLAVDEAIDF